MSKTSSASGGSDYQGLMTRYADIQKAAYKSQSAKPEDIKSLHEDMNSYFQAHTDVDKTKSQSILNDLGHMETMAQAHTDDPTHTDNDEWDSTRSEMDDLIKELAPDGVATSIIDQIPRGGGSGGGSSSGSGAGSGTTANYAVTGAGQGDGSGKGLNYNNPANSKEYKGLTIDQLMQGNGELAQAMKKHPDIVAEIKSASARTGVPAGLMAATAFRETTFGEDMSTSTDSGGASSVGVFQGGQVEMDGFNKGGKLGNLHDNVTMFANFMAAKYKDCGSWGGALRYWNSGSWDKGTPLPNPNNLSVVHGGAGIGSYVQDILGNICFGKSYSG